MENGQCIYIPAICYQILVTVLNLYNIGFYSVSFTVIKVIKAPVHSLPKTNKMEFKTAKYDEIDKFLKNAVTLLLLDKIAFGVAL